MQKIIKVHQILVPAEVTYSLTNLPDPQAKPEETDRECLWTYNRLVQKTPAIWQRRDPTGNGAGGSSAH